MSATPGTITRVTPAAILAAGITFPILGMIASALRFYTRKLQKARLMTDDYLIIPALILTAGMGISLIVGAQGKALGYPTPFPETDDLEVIVKYVSHEATLTQKVIFFFQLMQVLALGFVKLSILYFYRRIFCVVKGDIFDWINKIVVVITIAWSVSFFFAILFSCGTSFYAQWGSIEDTMKHCKIGMPLQNGYGISDFILDVFVLIMPIPKIWSLHMNICRKIAVTVVFLLGATSVVASFMKMYVFIVATNAGFDEHVDPDLEITQILYWSIIESGLALVVACLPTLQYLFGKVSSSAFFQSVRNTLSRDSIRLRHQQRSQDSQHIKLSEGNSSSNSSSVRFGKSEKSGTVETCSVPDLEALKEIPQGVICVRNEIYQVHNEA